MVRVVLSGRTFRTGVVLGTVVVVGLTVLNTITTRRSSSIRRSHAAGSGPAGSGVVTVTRVVSKFEDCVDGAGGGARSLLPSESSGEEVVLSVRDGFVLERGAVAEARTGVVFAVSGGCCLQDATVYSPGEAIEVQYQPSPAISPPPEGYRDPQRLRVVSPADNITSPADNKASPDENASVGDEAPIITTVCILEHSHSETYYHFLIEALPRLEHVWTLVSGDDVDHEGVRIFQTSPFAPSTFALLGLGPNRACGGRRTVYPTVLIPPPTQNPRDEATVTRLKSMTGRLVAAAGLADTGPEETPTWVVINREGAKARNILNHEELMAGLRDSFPGVVFREFGGDASDSPGQEGGGRGRGLGFHGEGVLEEGVEEGGVERSIRAFRSCWGVIAPHGAGLSNLVFLAKRNAAVVQIIGEDQTGKVYEALAEQFGHRHMYITAPHVTWQRSHMLVDVPAVLEAIAPIFE